MDGMWTKCLARDGRAYYFNAEKGISLWDLPVYVGAVIHDAPFLSVIGGGEGGSVGGGGGGANVISQPFLQAVNDAQAVLDKTQEDAKIVLPRLAKEAVSAAQAMLAAAKASHAAAQANGVAARRAMDAEHASKAASKNLVPNAQAIAYSNHSLHSAQAARVTVQAALTAAQVMQAAVRAVEQKQRSEDAKQTAKRADDAKQTAKATAQASEVTMKRLTFVVHFLHNTRYRVPPVFAKDNRDPDEDLYGVVLLANKSHLKICFQAVVRYLDPQSVVKLRMVTKEINREGERAMHRVWRYLVAVNYSSPFIKLPAVGGGEGQMSFTRAVYEVFFANKHQEVLIMGGIVKPVQELASSVGDVVFTYQGGLEVVSEIKHEVFLTNDVTKMIVEPNGTIRFEASTPMLLDRWVHDAVYHQGEVLSIGVYNPVAFPRGAMERLDTLTQMRTQLAERLPNDLQSPAAAALDNKLVAIGGLRTTEAGAARGDSDIMYELDEHASQAAQGKWQAHAARLNTARHCASVIAFQGKLFVCGGFNSNVGALRSVESFDPAICAWRVEGDMTQQRSYFSLCVFEDELYAMGGDGYFQNTTIEKLNKATKQWQLIADRGQHRYGCAAVLVGSKVFLFGGDDHKSTYDSFDLYSKKWASQDIGGAYFDKDKRQLPRQVIHSRAVLITPPAALAKEWTDLNVIKLENRDTARYNEQFEAVTGKAIQWDT